MPRKQQSKALTLSRKWEKLSGEHFRSFQLAREMTVAIMQREYERLQSGTIDPEAGKTQEYNISASDLRNYVTALAVAVAGEREAMSMSYQDSSRAIAHVQQLGFLVSAPDGGVAIDPQFATVDVDVTES